MNTARVNAYAKINLTLDITGAENGYHTLDSLVTTIDLADRIVARRRKDGLISVVMHGMGSEGIPPEENNARRAGEAFAARFGTPGADITVYKNIPIGAGLGGSSADAAGVLRAMAKLYGIADEALLKSIADGLGSDTGYLLTGGFARLTGRGERVEPLADLPALWLLLLCPRDGVSSAACYRMYDAQKKSFPPRTERALSELRAGNAAWAARLYGNALTEAAQAIEPAVGEALAALRAFSPLGAAMTGSGSAAYAVFETRELRDWAKSRYTGAFRALCAKSFDAREVKTWRNPFVLSEEERGRR